MTLDYVKHPTYVKHFYEENNCGEVAKVIKESEAVNIFLLS